MQTILDWLNNGWVIGIVGGIPSGLLVTYFSRLFLARTEKREYLLEVFAANREVIYSIKAGIPEGVIPTAGTVEKLIVATARKYSVDRQDVYGPVEIAEELTKEVMDSSFISPDVKRKYCDDLLAIIPAEEPPIKIVPYGSRGTEYSAVVQFREKLIEKATSFLGLIVAIVVATFGSFLSHVDGPSKVIDSIDVPLSMAHVLTIVLVFAVLGTTVAYFSFREFQTKGKRVTKKKIKRERPSDTLAAPTQEQTANLVKPKSKGDI